MPSGLTIQGNPMLFAGLTLALTADLEKVIHRGSPCPSRNPTLHTKSDDKLHLPMCCSNDSRLKNITTVAMDRVTTVKAAVPSSIAVDDLEHLHIITSLIYPILSDLRCCQK